MAPDSRVTDEAVEADQRRWTIHKPVSYKRSRTGNSASEWIEGPPTDDPVEVMPVAGLPGSNQPEEAFRADVLKLVEWAEEARGHYGIEECSGLGQPGTEWDDIQDGLRNAAADVRGWLADEGPVVPLAGLTRELGEIADELVQQAHHQRTRGEHALADWLVDRAYAVRRAPLAGGDPERPVGSDCHYNEEG